MTTLNNIRPVHDDTIRTLRDDTCDPMIEDVPHSITPSDRGNMKDVFSHISGLFSRLTSDLGELFSLHMDLFKAEVRDSAKTVARDSALLIVAGVFGWFAFAGLTLALIAVVSYFLPIESAFMAFAAGSAIVCAVYLVIAGILAFAGINHLKKRSLTPDRTIAEIQRDKQAVKEIR